MSVMRKNLISLFVIAMTIYKAGAQLQSPYLTSVSYDESTQKYDINWEDPFTPDSFKIYVFSGYTGTKPNYIVLGTTSGLNIQYSVDTQFTIGGKTYNLFNNINFFAVEAFKTGYIASSGNLTRLPFKDAPSNILLLKPDFDTCNYTIKLTWNKFYGWDTSNNEEYHVLYRTGAGAFQLWSISGENFFTDTSIIIPVNDASQTGQHLQFNTEYSFQIIAVNMAKSYNCYSNIRSLSTSIAAKPEYVNADGTKIIDDNHIQLSFITDNNSQLHKYKVLRSANYSGIYDTIASIDDSRKTDFILIQ